MGTGPQITHFAQSKNRDKNKKLHTDYINF